MLFFSSYLHAECQKIDTGMLRDLSEDVLEVFPQIQIAKNNLQIAKEELEQAGAIFDPTLDLDSSSYLSSYYSGVFNQFAVRKQNRFLGSVVDFGYRRGSGSFPIYENENLTANRGEFFTGVTIPLLQNLRIDQARFNEKQKEIDAEIKELSVQENLISLKLNFLTVFNNLTLSATNIQAIQSVLKKLEQQNAMIEQRVNSGLSAKNDLKEFRRLILESQVLLNNEKTIFNKQLNYLNRLYLKEVGRAVDVCEIPLQSKKILSSEFDLTDLIKEAFENRFDLQILAKQLDLAEIYLDFSKQQRLPDLRYRFEYTDGNGGGPEEETDQNFKNILQLNYPLFNRKANSELEISKARLENFQLSLELMRSNLSVELFAFLEDLQNFMNQLNNIDQEIKILEDLLDADYISYELGQTNLFQVNQRNLLLLDLIQKRNQSSYNYYQRLLSLHFFLNDTDSVWDIYKRILQ